MFALYQVNLVPTAVKRIKWLFTKQQTKQTEDDFLEQVRWRSVEDAVQRSEDHRRSFVEERNDDTALGQTGGIIA